MKNYKKKQNKKTLGIENLKGVTVRNLPAKKGTGFNVFFKAEVRKGGQHFFNGQVTTPIEAAELANSIFKNIYGNKRSAKKANYWNEIN